MPRVNGSILTCAVCIGAVLAAWPPYATAQNDIPADQPRFSGAAFKDHVRYLASDELAGRWPGTEGDQKAAAYIAERFAEIGLVAGAGHDDYLQDVPLVGTTTQLNTTTLTLRRGGETVALERSSAALRTQRIDCETCQTSASVVLGGYGISAPEYGWDDYGYATLDGRVVALLPGVPDSARAVLPGGTHSYYAEDGVKLEEARRRGAVGVVFLTAPEQEERFAETSADWTREFVQRGWARGRPLSTIAWLSPEATEKLLTLAGRSMVDVVSDANRAQFEASALDVSLQVSFNQQVRQFTSANVIGVVPGSRPRKGTVVVTAHRDHLGVGPPDDAGDTIYNGAKDNASGVAGLLLLSDAMKTWGAQRNVVFVATAAEEAGYEHIGARYYIENPTFPLDETVVNLNLDGVDVVWPTGDFRVLPVGATTADPILALLAEPLDRVISTAAWLPSLHFSFDTLEFMAQGIPGLTLWGGSKYRTTGIRVEELKKRYDRMGGRIHQPSDEFHPDWSEDAIEQHLELYWKALRFWASGGPPPAIDPDGPMAPVAIASAPPYRALARMIVERMALQSGEKVLLLCHPTLFHEIIPHVRNAVMRRGGVDLGCLQVLPQPSGPDAPGAARGFMKSREAIADLAREADVFVALPGTWPNQSAYLAVQDVLEKGHGRAIHFHWLGGYSLFGEQLPATPRLDRVHTNTVLDTDYAALADTQRRFVHAARKGEIRVTNPRGTDLHFRLGSRRAVNIQDGDASAARAEQARTLIDREVEVPAGAVRFAPLEDSIHGVVVFPDSYWSGELVRAPRLVFRKGKVIEVSAAENVDALLAELDAGGASARHFRGFALGFNPFLEVPKIDPWIPYYGYGAGVVRLSLGQNSELGGSVEGNYMRWNFFVDATVEIDGERWVEAGRLIR